MLFNTFLYSFFAAMFFALLFNVPRRSLPVTATIAGIGYVVFILVTEKLYSDLAGCFLATVIVGLLSEIAARILKMTTTTFITVAVIPLVPGLGIYRTMQFLVQNNYEKAAQIGIPTMLAAGTIALAIVVSTFIIKLFLHFWHQ
jgi:uncharacterized membrane protein YjjB (DUF3815 family)